MGEGDLFWKARNRICPPSCCLHAQELTPVPQPRWTGWGWSHLPLPCSLMALFKTYLAASPTTTTSPLAESHASTQSATGQSWGSATNHQKRGFGNSLVLAYFLLIFQDENSKGGRGSFCMGRNHARQNLRDVATYPPRTPALRMQVRLLPPRVARPVPQGLPSAGVGHACRNSSGKTFS